MSFSCTDTGAENLIIAIIRQAAIDYQHKSKDAAAFFETEYYESMCDFIGIHAGYLKTEIEKTACSKDIPHTYRKR